MQYALVNGLRKKAEPKLKGLCKHCNSEVIAKCGTKNIWHWAHEAMENCDPWYEPETQWHRDWKEHFGEECSEVTIILNDEKHIADVKTNAGVVIEFQNSTISPETIKEREVFYGEKMIWVINGEHFKKNFRHWDHEYLNEWAIYIETEKEFSDTGFYKKTPALVVNAKDIKKEEVKAILVKHKFDYMPEKDIYYKDIGERALIDYMSWEFDVYVEILETYKIHQRVEPRKKIKFEWNWTRRSWQDSVRPVFIDLNENELIWIKSGLGQKSGEGIRVSKQEFIEKYKS